MLCFIFLHYPLSGPDLTYISLLIIFCIIEYVTNNRTLTLTFLVNVYQILTAEFYIIKLVIALADTFPCHFPDIV